MCMAENEKEDINSLCKKYFTPELCEEPVTESKRTLEIKLLNQMIRFARYLFNNSPYKQMKLPKDYQESSDSKNKVVKTIIPTLENAIDLSIAKCLDRWRKNTPTVSYTAFFRTVFYNELKAVIDDDIKSMSGISRLELKLRQLKADCNSLGISFSVNEPPTRDEVGLLISIGYSESELENLSKYMSDREVLSLDFEYHEDGSNESNSTLADSVKDENTPVGFESEDTALYVFEIVDKAYKLKESKKHKEWLSPLLTCELFDGMHDFADRYGKSKLLKFKFVDWPVYELTVKPDRNDIAKQVGINASYLLREKDKFFELIQDELNVNMLD